MTLPIHNIFNVPILAFSLGIIAVLIRSDLKIPSSIGKFISLYLLFSIGFQGGVQLYQSTWNNQATAVVAIAMGMSIIIPIYVFLFIRRKFNVYNAAALAASYGSVSVVTFITAGAYLIDLKISYGGYIVTLVPLMDCCAIMVGFILIKLFNGLHNSQSMGRALQELGTNTSILILVAGLFIGIMSRVSDINKLYPLVMSMQKIMLTFFLIDMGLLVGRNIKNLKNHSRIIFIIGIIVPLLNATIGILLTTWLHLNLGDSLLLVILLASASYIAVPAAFRMAVPEAEPSLYISAALAITFPFNVIVGIPLYHYLLNYIGGL